MRHLSKEQFRKKVLGFHGLIVAQLEEVEREVGKLTLDDRFEAVRLGTRGEVLQSLKGQLEADFGL